MLSIILLFSYNKMHDFLYVVGYNGNCTSSDECARGFRCIEMKCSCLDTDTYFDGQEGCKKSILIVFMRKCVCQKYVKTIKSLPWIKTKKFDRIFLNVLVTHFDIHTFCRKTIQFFVWTWHAVLWGSCMQRICMCLQNKQHKLCAYGENVWLHTQ